MAFENKTKKCVLPSVVTLSEGSGSMGSEMLRYAQHDSAVPYCRTQVSRKSYGLNCVDEIETVFCAIIDREGAY